MAIDFTESDLKENQKGHLSAAQAKALRNDSIRVTAIICACLMVVVVLGILSAGDISGSELQGIGLLAFIFLSGAFWFYVLRTDAAIRSAKVEPLSGEATVQFSVNGIIFMMIGDRRFRLTMTEAKAFETGTAYTLYVIPHLNKIVSFEVYSRKPDPIRLKSETPDLVVVPSGEDGHEILRA